MISVRGIGKTFGTTNGASATPALADLAFDVAAREFVCIVGPSGCGKTTLLRIVAGLITPDAGSVVVDGAEVTGPGPERAIVFQQPTLLPWASVLTNVAFGLQLRGVPDMEREAIARGLVKTVGLEGFEAHYPRQLSGGMQQRVGLACALAVNPSILLMDEPFAAVDAQTRRLLQNQLLRLHLDTQKTIVFVTHDIDEAVRLGDRVLVMSQRPGRILESVAVPVPRPRSGDLESAVITPLKAHLWERLQAL
jgi:NitT/TauT family transport system ATP-binding protein